MNADSAALLQAIRGPVIMITIGVLFALENFTPLSFHETWPAILIVLGLLGLGGGMGRRSRSSGTPPGIQTPGTRL
ncbi:MAG: LiaI-LiaF-like domain-containing protein [Bryobacteraceae bacterium]